MSQSIDEVLLGTPARGAPSGDPEQRGQEQEQEQEGEGDKFVRQLFESLLLGTRASNAIPDGEGQEVCVPVCVCVCFVPSILATVPQVKKGETCCYTFVVYVEHLEVCLLYNYVDTGG